MEESVARRTRNAWRNWPSFTRSGGNFGAKAAFDASKELERRARTGDLTIAEEALTHLREEIRRLEMALNEARKSVLSSAHRTKRREFERIRRPMNRNPASSSNRVLVVEDDAHDAAPLPRGPERGGILRRHRLRWAAGMEAASQEPVRPDAARHLAAPMSGFDLLADSRERKTA